MEDKIEQPFLSAISNGDDIDKEGGGGDMGEINGDGDFVGEFCNESWKLWYLAAPAIFTAVCQYSIGAITQIFVGRIGTLELATLSVENSVIAGFSFGIMLGLGSALETLCGQAYGAGQHKMLGVYMQRSWIILNTAAIGLTLTYVFGSTILTLLGQTPAISKAAGSFAKWMIPQLFAYATIFPTVKFLQAQSKVVALAVIAFVAVVGNGFFSWLFIGNLGWGLTGAAVVLNGSWWFMTVAQMVYIFWGSCGQTWSGFSMKAFSGLWGFAKLSYASAIMICLEVWYTLALVVFAGFFENAEVSVDALSICLNILGWTTNVALGFNVAISVRVSNEIGLGRPRRARFSVLVLMLTSFLIASLFAIILITTRNHYASFFTSSPEVKSLVEELTLMLAVCIIVTMAQTVLSGVAIGAGWQAAVAYFNIGSYFLFGVPISYYMGYTLKMGVKSVSGNDKSLNGDLPSFYQLQSMSIRHSLELGIWYGMVSGVTVQTCLLIIMVCRTNWENEVDVAGDRMKQWGGETYKKDKEAIVVQ